MLRRALDFVSVRGAMQRCLPLVGFLCVVMSVMALQAARVFLFFGFLWVEPTDRVGHSSCLSFLLLVKW